MKVIKCLGYNPTKLFLGESAGHGIASLLFFCTLCSLNFVTSTPNGFELPMEESKQLFRTIASSLSEVLNHVSAALILVFRFIAISLADGGLIP